MSNIHNNTGRHLILPTAYEESLSYLEQLNKLCDKINELVEKNNELEERVARLEEK